MDIKSYLLGKKKGAGMSYVVVEELPETGENNTIYLVPKSTSGTNNYYDEYMYIGDEWEKIGDTEIDLSGYQPLLVSGTNIKTVNGNSLLGSGNLSIETVIDLNNVDYPQSNPLDIDSISVGTILYCKNGDSCGYIKSTTNGKTGTVKPYWSSSPTVLMLINRGPNTSNNRAFAFLSFNYTMNGSSQDPTSYSIDYRYFSQSQTSISNSYNKEFFMPHHPVMENSSATISSLHTYNTLPRSSVVPSNDNELVNKKYVDDAIAASITSALGGNY